MKSHLTPEEMVSFKEVLQAKKQRLEEELATFATKDPNVKGDWDSNYPRTPEGNLEEAAGEVEEYSTRLRIEYKLENDLKDVNAALERIQKKTYGICEETGKPIPKARLKVLPEARTC